MHKLSGYGYRVNPPSLKMNAISTITPGPSTSSSNGCTHYLRQCKFVSPCCHKVYTCRFCHDESEEHTLNRRAIKVLICARCNKRQPVHPRCGNCGLRFGKYTCLECNLFDDENKGQFHCQGCGICRTGGREQYFHCEKCNLCLPISLLMLGHKCVENASRTSCPVCLENLHHSRTPSFIPKCGHLLHITCHEELVKAGHDLCPTCQVSMKTNGQ